MDVSWTSIGRPVRLSFGRPLDVSWTSSVAWVLLCWQRAGVYADARVDVSPGVNPDTSPIVW